MGSKRLLLLLSFALAPLTGCLSPVRQDTDALVCHRAGLPVDVTAPALTLPPTEPPPAPPPEQKRTLLERLQLPANVPGAETQQMQIPENFTRLPAAEQDRLLKTYFATQVPVGSEPRPEPGPDGRPLTLADLQRLARENSPLLRQAASDIKAAEGAAWQAGAYPNPMLGLTSNSLGPNGGPLMGPTIQQTIKTAGKLKLAQDAAAMDLANAQFAYRRAETDLMASVRTAYYAVLVADTAIRANRALADLTDEVYRVMLAQLKAGEVATYEPLQVSVFAAQARMALIQSRNAYLLAWKQLAAAVGLPGMPATELAGSIDQSLPRFDYEKVLAHVLANHTDVLTAEATIRKMRYNLRLNEVTQVPDVTLGANVLYDATPPGPPRWVTFFTGSVTLPVWDRNQGGVKQAQGQLLRAVEEPHRVRAALTASVSDAYRRLEENRVILDLYRNQMLIQQAQAFRAAVLRHYSAGAAEGVAYNDLIAAEQNVVSLIGTYLTTLGAYWQAVSDLASLLQTDDAYQMAAQIENCPMPDLAKLLALPCCHPCSSLPNPALKGVSSLEAPPGRRTAPEPIEKVGGGAPPAVPAPSPKGEPKSPTLPAPRKVDGPTGAAPPAGLPGLGAPLGAALDQPGIANAPALPASISAPRGKN